MVRHERLRAETPVLLCLLAAVSYALAVISQKPALRHASALQVTTFGCAVGALACLPFTGQLVSQLATAPLTAALSVAYLGVRAVENIGQHDGHNLELPRFEVEPY